MESAAKLLKHGGRLCLFGVANPKATLTLHPFEVWIILFENIVDVENNKKFHLDIHEGIENRRRKHKSLCLSQGIGTRSCYG